MFEFVKEDIRRLTSAETGTMRKLAVMIFNPGFHAVVLHRLSRWFHLHHMQALAALISYFNSILTGAQISPRAMIGKGLTIYHPQGTVVGASAVIGNFCILVHGNVIGQLYGTDDRPKIGDHFYAGSGAKILGKIQIGNHVHVGPNAVVITSLPDGVTAAANPAKVIFSASERRTANNGAASREVILRRLLSLLECNFDIAAPIDSIGEDTGLLGEGIGLDSIEALRLIGTIEEEFHLTIDERDLQVSHLRSVGSLVNFIQERIS